MAKQVENLTSRILKSIQATLAEYSKRFDHIEDRLDEINEGMIAALGLASHAHVRDNSLKKEINDLKERGKRLEGRG